MTKQQLENESQAARTKAIRETKGLSIPGEPKTKVTILNIMAFLMFGSGLGLILYVIYLFAYPFNPLTISSVSVVTPTVPAGGTMIYRITSCKHTQLTPTINKKIVSATSAQSLPTVQGVITPGCSTKEVPVHIISGTPPGKYTLYTDVVYPVNALRDIHVFWKAGPFEVIK